MNPDTRILRQVNIESAAEADRIFSMLMGDEEPPRRGRRFIERKCALREYRRIKRQSEKASPSSGG